MIKYLKISNIKLPINKKKYLLDILNPTSKGSKYYETKPESEISKIQVGRIILQFHQILSLFKSLNINLKNKRMLDIGTGSGCIIISLLKNRPFCRGTAIDISRKAIKIAKFNAKMHHLENKINFFNIDIDKFNYNKYDFIISNPPYINAIDLKRLEDNVRLFEPHVALRAGMDGLSEIKKILVLFHLK